MNGDAVDPVGQLAREMRKQRRAFRRHVRSDLVQFADLKASIESVKGRLSLLILVVLATIPADIFGQHL